MCAGHPSSSPLCASNCRGCTECEELPHSLLPRGAVAACCWELGLPGTAQTPLCSGRMHGKPLGAAWGCNSALCLLRHVISFFIPFLFFKRQIFSGRPHVELRLSTEPHSRAAPERRFPVGG